MVELGISIAACVAIFYGGVKGSQEGLFRAFARFCLCSLASIAAMRFWFPGATSVAERLSVTPEQVSFGLFWGVFALLVMPFLFILRTLNNDFLPSYHILLERFGGFIFGAATGGFLIAALLLSLTLNLPRLLPAYDESKLLLPVHRLPSMIFRTAEATLAPGPSESRTLLPSLIQSNATPAKVRWSR